jgi:hypothetical protein
MHVNLLVGVDPPSKSAYLARWHLSIEKWPLDDLIGHQRGPA